MMIARRDLLYAGLCICAAWTVGEAGAAESPGATITALQKALVDTALRLQGASVAERYRALEPSIVATHDLPYIAEFALRRQWPMLTTEEKRRFVDAFQRLSVMTYAARFAGVAEDAFGPIEVGTPDANGRVEVTTAIRRAGQPDIALEYLLQRDGEDWRIVNVVADGVSDLALKRAEYQRLFASGGIDGLIEEIERQTQRLERD